MNDSEIKTQLLGLIRQTKDEVYTFCEYASTLVSEDTVSPRDRATKTFESLERFEKSLETAFIADTQDNLKLVEAIRDQLASIRHDVPGLATSFRLNHTLINLGRNIEKAAKAPEGGRKLLFKPKLEPFVEGSDDAFKESRADELTASVYILERLNMSEELFSELGGKMKRGEMPRPPRPYVAATDPDYNMFQTSIAEYTEMARQAYQSGDMELAQAYLDAADAQTEARDIYLAGKQEEMAKALAQYKKAMTVYKKQNPHENIVEQFKEISRVFTGEGLVSYTTRAKIMADMGVGDLGELFRQYVDAAMDGDKDTMDNIYGLLINIKQTYDAQRKIAEQNLEVAEAIPVIEEEETEAVKAKPRQVDADRMARMFGTQTPAGGAAGGTTVREDGQVERVNTEAEAKPKVSERFGDLISRLGGSGN